MNKTGKHSGAGWVESQMGYSDKWQGPLSQFGRDVANLLGDLYDGIYHLPNKRLQQVDWSSKAYIEIAIETDMATFDGRQLTRLVFLCHDYGMRGALSPRSLLTMRLMFHPNSSLLPIFPGRDHPSLEGAMELYRQQHPLPEPPAGGRRVTQTAEGEFDRLVRG